MALFGRKKRKSRRTRDPGVEVKKKGEKVFVEAIRNDPLCAVEWIERVHGVRVSWPEVKKDNASRIAAEIRRKLLAEIETESDTDPSLHKVRTGVILRRMIEKTPGYEKRPRYNSDDKES